VAKVRRGVDQEEQKRGEIRRRGKELIYVRIFFFFLEWEEACVRGERNRGIDWGRRVREKEIEELIEEFIGVDV
jgi:hypothetical protein